MITWKQPYTHMHHACQYQTETRFMSVRMLICCMHFSLLIRSGHWNNDRQRHFHMRGCIISIMNDVNFGFMVMNLWYQRTATYTIVIIVFMATQFRWAYLLLSSHTSRRCHNYLFKKKNCMRVFALCRIKLVFVTHLSRSLSYMAAVCVTYAVQGVGRRLRCLRRKTLCTIEFISNLARALVHLNSVHGHVHGEDHWSEIIINVRRTQCE